MKQMWLLKRLSHRMAAQSALSRVAAVSLLVAATALLACAVFLPLHRWYSDCEQRLDEALVTKARLKVVADYGNAQNATFDVTAIEAHASDFLAGGEDGLIAANLQTKLRGLVVSRASEFMSARTLTTKLVDGLIYLGVKIQLKGELHQIQHIIHSIETATPFLFIERAQLRLDERRALVGAAQDGMPRLQAELDVYGAKWPGSPAVPQPKLSR